MENLVEIILKKEELESKLYDFFKDKISKIEKELYKGIQDYNISIRDYNINFQKGDLPDTITVTYSIWNGYISGGHENRMITKTVSQWKRI